MSDREAIVDELFGRAIELEPASRESFLAAEATRLGPGLVDEVKALLNDHDEAEANSFLRRPLISTEANEPTPTLKAGQEFEGYQIVGLIAEGGMGEVYLAEDKGLARQVAIKVIKGNLKTKEILRRFQSERQILANLQHPNIAQLFEAGATPDGLPFFVMEFVEGQPIDKFANEHELSVTETLKLFRAVCSAVSYAHQNLVVHRDLKPGNIIVTKEREPKLLDFGIAKLLHEADAEQPDVTATLFRVMTPEYASPEQVKGEPITTATDVYSLGVLLYELLTGRRPYKLKRRTTDEITKAICEQEPEKPSAAVTREHGDTETRGETKPKSGIRNPKPLRGDLDNIVLKALRKEPERRYGSVEQFSEDIRRHLEGLPILARKATLSYRTSKFIKRNKIGVAAAALIFLTLGGGIVATTIEARRANRRFNDVRRLAHSVLFDYQDAIAALPGSTAVRQRLVRDGLDYLDNLSKEAGSDTSLLRELAGAYEKLMAVQGGTAATGRGTLLSTSNLGDTRGAMESERKALAIRERVFALEPNNKDVRKELALCYLGMGGLYVATGPPDKPVEYARKAMPTLEALLAADPRNEELQSYLSDLYFGMARVLGSPGVPNLGDTQGALEYATKAQSLSEKLVASHPTSLDYRATLGSVHNLLGLILNGSGKLSEALEHYQKALVIDQELVKGDPINTSYRRELAIQLGNVGSMLTKMGDKSGALENFKQAVVIYDALVAADPNDADIRRNDAVGYRNLGAAVGTSNRAEALAHFHKALQIFAELNGKDTNNADFRRQWAFTYLALSRFQSQADDLNGAVDSALQGIKIDEVLVAASPTNASARNTLAQLDGQLGATHAALAARAGGARQTEQWHAAKEAYQKSLDIYQDMKTKGTLSGADAGKPDEIAKEIARCDAALAVSEKR